MAAARALLESPDKQIVTTQGLFANCYLLIAVPLPEIIEPDWDKTELDSLSKCLDQLSARDRDLITRYYQGEGRERIAIRREMATEAGGADALRIQIYRIRATLRHRLSECVRRQTGKPQALADRDYQ